MKSSYNNYMNKKEIIKELKKQKGDEVYVYIDGLFLPIESIKVIDGHTVIISRNVEVKRR